MLRLYRGLLMFYPASYRDRFGDEMIAVFMDVHSEASHRKRSVRAALYARETTGLIAGALREHARALGAGDWVDLSTRRFNMRSGFRFPKATWVLMTIILAGVIAAIHKGEVIATSLPPFSQPITPIHPAHSYLLPGVVAGFIFFYAAGLIGWAVLFALRRSGVHRLDDMQSEK